MILVILPTTRFPGESSEGRVMTVSLRVRGFSLGTSIICGMRELNT